MGIGSKLNQIAQAQQAGQQVPPMRAPGGTAGGQVQGNYRTEPYRAHAQQHYNARPQTANGHSGQQQTGYAPGQQQFQGQAHWARPGVNSTAGQIGTGGGLRFDQRAPQSPYYQQILGHLTRLVQARGWQRFYPSDRLAHVAAEASRHDYDALASRYGIPTEIVTELSKLALVDIMFYCDDSTSMNIEGRWDEDLQKIIETTVEICTMFDTDGVDVRFMNNPQSRDRIRNASDVRNLISGIRPNGLTPLGTNLENKILKPYYFALRQAIQSNGLTGSKPLLVICITDGEPQGEPRDATGRAIMSLHHALRQLGLHGHEVNYQFAQVGTDSKAQAFLDGLDNDPQIGNLIDAISNYEIEADQFYRKNGGFMNPYIYMMKMLLGGICPEWDEKD